MVPLARDLETKLVKMADSGYMFNVDQQIAECLKSARDKFQRTVERMEWPSAKFGKIENFRNNNSRFFKKYVHASLFFFFLL